MLQKDRICLQSESSLASIALIYSQTGSPVGTQIGLEQTTQLNMIYIVHIKVMITLSQPSFKIIRQASSDLDSGSDYFGVHISATFYNLTHSLGKVCFVSFFISLF